MKFDCRQYRSFPLSDRRRHHLKERKVPVGEIAHLLGRHRSTNYRGLKRNTFHDRNAYATSPEKNVGAATPR
jgi:IS30 family transposase